MERLVNLWVSNPSVVVASIALIVSVGSLCVAVASLVWNIYKDLWQRGKMRISLMHAIVVQGEKGPFPRRLSVTITNFGPKKTRAGILELRRTSFLRKVFRTETHAVLQTDYRDPLSGKLPADLEIGDKVTLTFRYLPDLFLNADFNQLGVTDPFGQTHWCSRKSYESVRLEYLSKKKQFEAGSYE